MNVPVLPTVNATLNGIAAILQFAGWIAFKRGKNDVHRNIMIGALVASSLFLACYLYYHFTVAGVTRYQGQGFMRVLYFTILITHTPLAALMTPFILAAVWYASKGQYVTHRRITRWVWPVWMYVSVTGVLIYVMLYLLPPGSAGGAQGA